MNVSIETVEHANDVLGRLVRIVVLVGHDLQLDALDLSLVCFAVEVLCAVSKDTLQTVCKS